MSTKMLIDASHPEETRVAVMKGNRVEEFDFESQNRKQLRGNIYLAKVTRVEPSLQAAFVEYGGNRHGFLAFSEIHPDYYQIPLADRQALLREEAEAAAEEAEVEEARATRAKRPAPDVEDDAEGETEKPKRRRRSRRRSKSSDEESTDEVTPEESGASDEDDDAPRTMAADNESESVSEPAGDATDEKPKRRTRRKKASEPEAEVAPAEEAVAEAPKRRTRRKKVEEPTADAAADAAPSTAEGDDTLAKPKRRSRRKAAEPAASAEVAEPAGSEEEAPAKPKRRSRRKTAEPEAVTEADAAVAEEETPAKPKRRSRRKKADETDVDASESSTDEAETEARPESSDDESPRRPRRSRSRKTQETADEAPSDETAEVGAADALEEVPVRKPKRRHYKIQEVVKRRQIMLVQVVKEERGNKGAALTTYLSLAGRYSVLMPNTARGGGISRKITSAADRKKLKEIASSLEVTEGMGVILRTAGAERTRSEITRDFEYLLRLWENVRTLTLKSTAPCLVYEEGSLIKRSIRDLFDKDTKEIHVAGREGYEEARGFMEMLEPEQANAVRFYNERTPLFAKMGVEAQLDNMLQPQVTLKSGGYLVINQTEALVAIDVNSGKSTKQHSIEDTAYQTNLEAADEVARQLRLRDLAGLIVIDFIDMDDRRNNRNVEKRVKDALKNDRARIQVGRISHFGLMEMSRQRMRASVIESATETCPVCAGLGYVRSPSSVSIHVLRGIEEHLLRSSKHDLTVKTRLQTALYILNHKRSSIDDLEARFGVRITVEADETIGQSHYAIERGEMATARQIDDTHVQVDSIQPDERGEEPEAEAATETQAAASSVRSDDQPDDGEGSGKRRRRGRRGGRKPKSDDMGEETSASADESEPEASVEAPAEEEPKPKRRRRRAKPAEDAGEVTTQAEVKADLDTAEPTNDEPKAEERPKRRSTSRPRRKKAAEAVGDGAVHATSDAVMEGVVGETVEDTDEPPRPARRRTSRKAADAEAPSADDGDGPNASQEKPEKKGWLKRTFFPE